MSNLAKWETTGFGFRSSPPSRGPGSPPPGWAAHPARLPGRGDRHGGLACPAGQPAPPAVTQLRRPPDLLTGITWIGRLRPPVVGVALVATAAAVIGLGSTRRVGRRRPHPGGAVRSDRGSPGTRRTPRHGRRPGDGGPLVLPPGSARPVESGGRRRSRPAGGVAGWRPRKSKESELGNDPRTYYDDLEAGGLAWGRARPPFVYYNGWIVAGLIQA